MGYMKVIIFHFGVHAQTVEVITHEMNAILGLSLGSDD